MFDQVVKILPKIAAWEIGEAGPSSACRHRPGSSHWSRPVLRPPANGAKGICRDLSIPTSALAWHVPSPRLYGERV